MLRKNNRGITLIALVVTIIVLLILAGISISMLTGQNGILNRATEAKEKTETSSVDEKRKLAQAEALMNTERTTYKGVTLPEGFAPTKIDGEDSTDEGLVITDGYGNEYVWVEVPKTAEVYKNSGLGITGFSDEECGKIENDLKKYTEGYSDSNYNDRNLLYAEQYKNMLKSIYENKGFFVGRYEAGYEIDESKNEKTRYYDKDYANKHPTEQKAVIKKDVYPYNWVRQSQAQMLAENMNYKGCTSSLMFGLQWDLVLRFIEEKTVESANGDKENTRIDIRHKLQSDSTDVGNYNDNVWNVENKNAKYSKDNGNIFVKCPYQKKNNESILLTTGADEKVALINIYDIAGNVMEWTLEFYASDKPSVCRGGRYYSGEGGHPAKFHNANDSAISDYGIGFRIAIY